MTISSELIRIAEEFIRPHLLNRNERTRQALYRRQYDAEKAGRSGEQFYATDQQDACIKEIHLSAAFAAFGRVTDLTQPPPGQESFQATAQHDSLVVAALRQGIAAGDSVSASFLDWLHPGMRNRFRNEYLAGQRLYLQGLLEQDASKQIRGIHQSTVGISNSGVSTTIRSLPKLSGIKS